MYGCLKCEMLNEKLAAAAAGGVVFQVYGFRVGRRFGRVASASGRQSRAEHAPGCDPTAAPHPMTNHTVLTSASQSEATHLADFGCTTTRVLE
jgi:hypothetical protein